jgi:NADH dehydrogenase
MQPLHLVVGATGNLGGAIAHMLLERGERVRALVRPGSATTDLAAAGAELVQGDLKEPSSLEAACAGADRIVATATAAIRGGDDTAESVDRAGYQALAAAAAGAGIGRFVYVSAHGFHVHSPVALARAKSAAEAAIRESGIGHVILRPTLFMEAWVSMIVGAQLEHGDVVTVLGSPDRRYGFVSALDVAQLAVAVATSEESADETLAFSTESASYRQIVDLVGERTGRSIDVRSVPPGTALPGLPPVVLELWSWAAEGGMDDLETPEVARRFGIEPIGIQDFVEGAF